MSEQNETAETDNVSRSAVQPVVMKPCQIPCEKCGSDDVRRKFIAKGERVPYEDYDKCKSKYGTGQCRSWSATRDHIHNHCNTCQYTWQTLPMKKRKAS